LSGVTGRFFLKAKYHWHCMHGMFSGGGRRGRDAELLKVAARITPLYANRASRGTVSLIAKPVPFFLNLARASSKLANLQKVQNKNQICRINPTAPPVLHM